MEHMLDQALDSGDADHKTDDSPGHEHVQIQGDGTEALGQVAYRVVQVGPAEGGDGATFPPGTQVSAVIQSPFSNDNSPNAEGQEETRFTYFPAVSAGGDASVTQAGDVAAVPLGQVTPGGQFYVMMSPQDVLQGQRNIAPRTHPYTPKMEGGRNTRDERRRATHNEVERRRRDKINNWIVQLSKLVPECAQDHLKQASMSSSQSKGGILSKACDYITELRNANSTMMENLKESERLRVDYDILRQQCEELKQENALLRAQLQQHGIVPAEITGTTS